MALGATVRQIVSGMLRQTLRTAALGLAAGLAAAFALTRAFSGAIEIVPDYGLRPFVVGAMIVFVATTTAALLPSLRTARIDPARALRVE
jgi:ABC-type antimicrobial peptide transport system permease subunit